MTQKRTDPEVLNEVQAAKYSGVSRMTFRKYILPNVAHRRAGARLLIRRASIDAWLEGHDEKEAA